MDKLLLKEKNVENRRNELNRGEKKVKSARWPSKPG